MTEYLSFVTQHFIFYVVDMMKFVFTFLSCVLFSTALGLPNQVAKMSAFSQNRCRTLFHKSTMHSQIVEAFLCGIDLPEGNIRSTFIQTSLYHLIVVSGSHLSFLILCLEFLKLNNSIFKILASCGLTLLTGFQPPIVRALFQYVTSGLCSFFRWHWKGTHKLILGSLVSLSLFPLWIDSLSFQLSLGAILSLNSGQLFFQRKNDGLNWQAAVLSYLLLLPLLLGWGQLHPAGILTNLLIAPVLMLLRWLICASWLFLPDLMEQGLKLMMAFLHELATAMPMSSSRFSFNMAERWCYLVLLMGILWGTQIYRERHR